MLTHEYLGKILHPINPAYLLMLQKWGHTKVCLLAPTTSTEISNSFLFVAFVRNLYCKLGKFQRDRFFCTYNILQLGHLCVRGRIKFWTESESIWRKDPACNYKTYHEIHFWNWILLVEFDTINNYLSVSKNGSVFVWMVGRFSNNFKGRIFRHSVFKTRSFFWYR